MPRPLIIVHSPRRLFWRPWRKICRCGFGAWPCYVQTMRESQAKMVAAARQPSWNAPTGRYREAPLLTRAQAERGHGGRAGPRRSAR